MSSDTECKPVDTTKEIVTIPSVSNEEFNKRVKFENLEPFPNTEEYKQQTKDFVNFIKEKDFKYVIFDFDKTLTTFHTVKILERNGWENNIDQAQLSNSFLLECLIKDGIIVYIFTHGVNEMGIRQVLEKYIDKSLSDKITIVAGRDKSHHRSEFALKPKDSIIKDIEFKISNGKTDMFQYVSKNYSISFDNKNTIFFDDDINNTQMNQDFCLAIHVSGTEEQKFREEELLCNAFHPHYLKKYMDQIK